MHPNTRKVARHLNLPRIAEPAVSEILIAYERALWGMHSPEFGIMHVLASGPVARDSARSLRTILN